MQIVVLFHYDRAKIAGAQMVVIFPFAGFIKTERPEIAGRDAGAGVKSRARYIRTVFIKRCAAINPVAGVRGRSRPH